MAVDVVEKNEAPAEEMELKNEETNVLDDWTTISLSHLRVNDGLDTH